MDSLPNTPKLTSEQVSCPDCGKVVRKRGLAGHLRLAHGIAARKQPPAPLPSPQKVDLGPVLAVLARIEQRLQRVEDALASGAGAPAGGDADGGPSRELEQVLEEIADLATRPDDPEVEDAERAEAERRARLGELRRRQAELLYELGPDSEAARLILESAFG